MEQEKIIQVGISEIWPEESETTVTSFVALSNTSRIFYGGADSSGRFKWEELPCPLTKPEPTSEDVI